MDNNILKVQDLVIQYKTEDGIVQAVNDVSFSLEKGETLGLVGETGAGKTTTALGIMNLIPSPPGKILKGSVQFEGRELLSLSVPEMRKIRGKKISMIFQDPMTSLNPVITIGDQVAEAIRLHEKLSRADAQEKALSMLELVGIKSNRYAEYPHQFSGGMKQRVMIAMALACNPELLIADEPTTALDVTIQAQVLRLMQDLRDHFQTSMIMITHDLGVVAEVCSKVAIMYAGEIVEYGNLRQIYHNTKHPYTQGLFGSLPNLNAKVDRLKPIPGLMPDPTNLPSGCKFAPRCQYATDACRRVAPPNVVIEEGHSVRCLRYAH